MDTLKIEPARATDPDVAAVIAAHFALMRASSPEESCHVMPADQLDREGAVLLAARNDGNVLGIGALKEFAPGCGELKSMHTIAAARGRGVAKAILLGLIDTARANGLTSLSLETGSDPIFAPARRLYESQGFIECDPFDAYQQDPLSVFMTKDL